MFWLRRPPYSRWATAALIVLVGLAFDLRPTPTVTYPYAAQPIPAGTPIAGVEWRAVPSGALPEWTGPTTGFATADIETGTPIVPSLVASFSIPAGWWAVTLPLPRSVPPGTPVRVATGERAADGIAAGIAEDDGYQIRGPVAFPPELVDTVATMATDSALVVMVGSLESRIDTSG